ncbi:MAG TPA: glycyl-radical enzyme activating protein [Chloroflexi bacterium]|nr:glycyl-radical enzyme activating protein [Chloroflexota bacterium]
MEIGDWEQVEGIVFDIQRYSVHDGPGLRTNVFLKGCPLRCAWCANPESQSLQPELMLAAPNCMTCGQFETPCPVCWEQASSAAVRSEALGERPFVCPTGAIHWIGARRTAGEVMAEVRRDAPFYDRSGGLTLTGGEATMQPVFAEALLRLARAEGIHTALETSGHTQWTVFARLLPHLDLLLYDVKHVDSELHRRYTGLDNALILANLRRIADLPAPKLIVRVPVIPGFNADPASLTAIATFVLSLGQRVSEINLLPYHTLGKSKYQALGRTYPWQDQPRLSDAEMQRLAAVMAKQVEGARLPMRVGG